MVLDRHHTKPVLERLADDRREAEGALGPGHRQAGSIGDHHDTVTGREFSSARPRRPLGTTLRTTR